MNTMAMDLMLRVRLAVTNSEDAPEILLREIAAGREDGTVIGTSKESACAVIFLFKDGSGVRAEITPMLGNGFNLALEEVKILALHEAEPGEEGLAVDVSEDKPPYLH